MESLAAVAHFVGSVAAIATSSAPRADRIEAIADKIGQTLPLVGLCIATAPDSTGRGKIVCSRGYPDRVLDRLGSSDFFDEWQGLQPSARGTRLEEAWGVDPLPDTVRDYIEPLGIGGGVSIPVPTNELGTFGGLHISTESAGDLPDLTQEGLRLIAPALNNLIGPTEARCVRRTLTAREREVLELIAAGRSNAEIAAELYIAPRTAATHVEHILTKLGAANRAHAVAIGFEFELIPTG